MTPLLAFQADATGVDHSSDSVARHQRHGEQSRDRRADRHPLRLLPAAWRPPDLNCASRCCSPRPAPAMCSSRWRRSSRAPTSPTRNVSASRTRTRRASCSTPRRCSSATSSPATTASRAARAPISASAIPAPSAMAGQPTRIVGQSYHLGGDNSFASPDLVNVGAYSGLETDTSDFVGLVGFATPTGLSASASARLDEQTLRTAPRRDSRPAMSTDALSVTAQLRLHPGAAALRLRRRSPGADVRRLDALARELARLRLRHLRFRE